MPRSSLVPGHTATVLPGGEPPEPVPGAGVPQAPSWSVLPAERLEPGSELAGQQVRLFPRGEVAASVDRVVVDEVVRVRALGPAPRGLVELVGKHAHGKR